MHEAFPLSWQKTRYTGDHRSTWKRSVTGRFWPRAAQPSVSFRAA